VSQKAGPIYSTQTRGRARGSTDSNAVSVDTGFNFLQDLPMLIAAGFPSGSAAARETTSLTRLSARVGHKGKCDRDKHREGAASRLLGLVCRRS